ncbi:MAG: aminotransferase class V-fold PLP-dependent enzyme [Candidatus Berkiella sp.]
MEKPSTTACQVLKNAKGEYLLWEGYHHPPGSLCVFGPDTKTACQDYITKVTTVPFNYFYGTEGDPKITEPDIDIQDLKEQFKQSMIPEIPWTWQDYEEYFYNKIQPFTINTGSPKFIGHMTSKLPSFHLELSEWLTSLNQNVVKLETSKVMTFLEREVIAMLHRLFYQFTDDYYGEHIQHAESDLGMVVSGGTQANVLALWVARNRALPGIAEKGFTQSLALSPYLGTKILVSPLLHYSFKKACSLLGIGIENIEELSLLSNGQLDIDNLQARIKDLQKNKIKIIALIGIAGATETGSIDPLQAMGEMARRYNIHFHVDASFGGPFLFSSTYRHLLNGIETADSITVCGHKQLYLPVGISLCLFRDERAIHAMTVLADYQAVSKGFDFGKNSPEGTRSAMALFLHASLYLFASSGYEKLLDSAMQLAKYFIECLKANDAFEILWQPDLNVINYRYLPPALRSACGQGKLTPTENHQINQLNMQLQKLQYQAGKSFISMTWLPYLKGQGEVVALRAILFNPLTQRADIDAVLQEQIALAAKIESVTP